MDTKVNGKKRKNDEKSLCKYGLSCYQKNPEHLKKFKHPVKGTIDKCFNGNSLKDAPKADTSEKTVKGTAKTYVKTSVKDEDDPIDSVNLTLVESVDEILKSMPEDFFDFWKFCESLNKSKPQDAFSEVGLKLVGVYDLLAKKLPKNKKLNISCHWRYFYDPPEFQTVIKQDGEDLYHIGYFRDDPSEMPSILASNSAAKDSKLTLVGDNIFCAMDVALIKIIKSVNSKASRNKATELQEELLKFASQKKYSTNIETSKTKKRQKSVVAKTFHGLGIVVPVINDVGYRSLPDTDAEIKTILKKIVTAEDESKRLDEEEMLDEIITNINFANDECDYGMGLEFGIDLFCYGDPYFHPQILTLLSLAYNLLKRPKYALIIEAHLKNRKKNGNLSTL